MNPRPHILYQVDGDDNTYIDSLGFLPFFRLDNNKKQFSNLKAVKDLIDDYDLMASSLSNNLIDFDHPLYAVKGFEGDNLDELQQNLKTKKIVGVGSDGGIEVHTVDVPYEARKIKLELDEKNIYRFGMGLNLSGLKDTSATTNIAIKAAYSLLDLRCKHLERNIKRFLRKIVAVCIDEINQQNGTDYQITDVYFEFTHEVMSNEQENEQNELTEAQKQQVQINTLLSLAQIFGDDLTIQYICDVLDIDYEDVKDKLQERAAFFGLDKTQSFNDFKQKYLKLPDNADTMNVKEYDVLAHTQKLKGAMSSSDYDEYMKILTEHSNTSLQKLYAKYADKISGVSKGKSGYYRPADNKLVFSYPIQRYIDNGKSKYGTLAHEYGHFFDAKADYEGLHFNEVETIHSKTKYQTNRFAKVASSSDEFLTAVRKDRQFLKSILTDDIEKELRDHDASGGVQDAIDGLLSHRINWGHGDKYYNRKYHSVKQLKEHKGLQAAYKELGIDASNLSKVANECRVYESASEMWANIMGAEVNGGSELEYVKKYLPNSYEAFIEILKGVK